VQRRGIVLEDDLFEEAGEEGQPASIVLALRTSALTGRGGLSGRIIPNCELRPDARAHTPL
jgi:hypothetical protein